MKAIEDLNYVPNGAAQGMARRATEILGLVYRRREIVRAPASEGVASDLVNVVEHAQHSLVYYDQLIRGLEEAAMRSQHMLLLRGATGKEESEAIIRMTGKCDGLVLMDRLVSDADIERIRHQVPLASIANRIDCPGVTSVLVDNAAAMTELVDHMFDLHGARHFAFLGGPEDSDDAEARATAVRQRVAERGGTLEPIEPWRGDYTPLQGFNVAIRMLSQDDIKRPDVIMCANDSSAAGVLVATRRLGISVPADMAVTGFDDTEVAHLLNPALTTAKQPIDRMADIAVQAVLDPARSGSDHPIVERVPAEVIYRRSCGCHPEAASPGPVFQFS